MTSQNDKANPPPSRRKEIIGDCTLYLGNCEDILPSLGSVGAVITDPPYGIGASGGVGKYGIMKWKATDSGWDNAPPSECLINSVLAASKKHIIWGGNYFMLPPTRCFLVWDKGAGFRNRTFAECEMAWTSFDANAKVFTRDPLAAGDYRGKEHPTQKPVALMQWCIEFARADSILDPFMGSGSAGVACALMGKCFIGIEIEDRYFDIACKRIRRAYSQSDMFVGQPSAPITEQTEQMKLI
jgi:DNA modification methylase